MTVVLEMEVTSLTQQQLREQFPVYDPVDPRFCQWLMADEAARLSWIAKNRALSSSASAAFLDIAGSQCERNTSVISERLRPDHLLAVELQPAQSISAGVMTREYAEHLCSLRGVGWALVDGGAPIGCGGIVEIWENRAQAWTLLSPAALTRFRAVHRMTRGVLAEAPWRRIEMDVDAAHAAGIAWATRLGFVAEGLRRKYTVDGRDVILFAKVK